MRRLYLSILVALLGVGLGCIVVAWVASATFRSRETQMLSFASHAAHYMVEGVPRHDPEALRAALEERSRHLGMSVSMWDDKRTLLYAAGQPLTAPQPGDTAASWVEGRDHVWGVRAPLPEGGWVALGRPHRHGPEHLVKLIGVLGCMLAVLALGSYWVSRRITRRLEALQAGVARFGEGDLSARAPVSGRDEVSELAEAFNRASARIEGLVGQQRRMLQSASHELRTPLTRLRMALALMAEPDAPAPEQLIEQCEGDIEELDALIEDLLLAARLQDSELPRRFDAVDLQQLLGEEAERVGARCEAAPVTMQGNARLLRSLMRNLLQNARRYGADPIEAQLAHVGGTVQLRIEDRGPGIAAEDAERIFEPFYRPQGHAETRDGGVGLGLSLVRQVAEHHGGSVRYAPRPEGGSRFLVELPVGRASEP